MRTSRHIGKWSITALVAMALAALVLMASCQEPASQVPGSASITVRVADATDSKTITPSGGVDVSHYRVTIDNVAEDVHMTSGYLEKDTSFTANNVPEGMWTATVDAYVKNGDAGTDSDYVHVATATSAETRVVAGEQAVLTVTLDSLLDSLSGGISITLLLPSELDDEGTSFWYSYSIRGTGQRSGVSISHDERRPARTGADGACTIPISEPLEQGSYLLTLKVFDSADASTTFVERTGVEVMRLLPGLEASGTVNLDSQVISEEGFSIDITDTTGDLLVPRTEDGRSLYEIDATGTLTPFTVTLSEPVPAGFVLQWYVDGDETEAESTDGRSFTMSIAKGMHSVIGIMRDDSSAMSVGSVSFNMDVKTDVIIEEQMGDEPEASLVELNCFESGRPGDDMFFGDGAADWYRATPGSYIRFSPKGMVQPVVDEGSGSFETWLPGYRYLDKDTGAPVDLSLVFGDDSVAGNTIAIDTYSLLMQLVYVFESLGYEVYSGDVDPSRVQYEATSEEGLFSGQGLFTPPVLVSDGTALTKADSLSFPSGLSSYDIEVVPMHIRVEYVVPDSPVFDLSTVEISSIPFSGAELLSTGGQGLTISSDTATGLLVFTLLPALVGTTEVDNGYQDSYGNVYPFRLTGGMLETDFDYFDNTIFLMQGDDMSCMLDFTLDELQQYSWTVPVAYEGQRVQVALYMPDMDVAGFHFEGRVMYSWITPADEPLV